MYLRCLIALTALAIGGASPAWGQADWTGKIVLAKGNKTNLIAKRQNGRFPPAAFSGLTFRVIEDRNGRILIQEKGVDGWATKADFVLLQSAAEYFTARIRGNPNDGSAYGHRAIASTLTGEEPDFAMRDFAKAIRLAPTDRTWWIHRGFVWARRKNYDKAIADFDEVIRLNPMDVEAFYYRGDAWYAKKNYDKAIADYDEVIPREPKAFSAMYNRGTAWFAKKNYDKAIADYNEVIRRYPEDGVTIMYRGTAWLSKKNYDNAIADYDEVIRLNPEDAVAFNNRGWAWHRKKDYGKAIADYNEALRLEPKYARACNTLAWLLATCPDAKYRDGKRAIELATEACARTHGKRAIELATKESDLTAGKLGNPIDTLAAAYAEAGNFKEAVQQERRALSNVGMDPAVAAGYRERLKLYEQKKPYHED